MTRNIFFLIMTIVVIVGCSKHEEEPPFEATYWFGDAYNSKDSVHQYAIDFENLYKQKRGEQTIVWKKPCIYPDPVVIDLGYGETKTIEYRDPSVVLDTDDNIFIICNALNETNLSRQYSIGVYDISGNFIINKKADFIVSREGKKFIEMNDKNILVINNGYTIIDKNVNVIERHPENRIPYKGNLIFINNSKYVTYDNSSILVFDLQTKKELDLTLADYVNTMYQNELYPPKYLISKVNIGTNYVNVLSAITLYNGKKENINVKFNYTTGEYMK